MSDINNKKFIAAVRKSKKTITEISRGSGIPISIISDLYNNITDFNNSSINTAQHLAIFFKCEIEDLSNTIVWHGAKFDPNRFVMVDGKMIWKEDYEKETASASDI